MAIEYHNAPSEMSEEGEKQSSHSRPLRRIISRWGALVGALVLVGVIAFAVPMPYVITSPGPTYDVLGSMNGNPVIDIDDPDVVNQSEGQLRMVTVSSLGGPDAHVSLVDYLLAKLDPSSNVRPVEEVYPRDLTREELDELNKVQMMSSQSTAASVALEELGYDVGATMTIAGASSGSHAEGVVEEGDVLQAIITPDGERHAVDRPSVPFALPKTLPPETPVKLEILRNGEKKTLAMRTYLPENAELDFEGSRFGIYLTADVTLPIDVTIHLENVGGPSAGLMFTLGIIDKFTGGDSTGGAIIAGTGAIGYDGEVQPIGGIVQKMYGSKRDGAQWFLAPKSNCDEVVGNIPDGLEVWPVATLADAREAVQSISKGATINHPVCEVE
ncbi:S16 family serine protease [uncultured Actinomyces sp.]|uniref:YlbL family protein n=1 Tax=uncultured Actinomyces sp. TaxID=249061 RepID=UPI00261A7D1A|nr:S16 family serine protease [uncultured Actinomyces sp.]